MPPRPEMLRRQQNPHGPHALRQNLGRARRPHRGRRHRHPLHRPPPGARSHQPAGVRRPASSPAARSGACRPTSRSADHNVPTTDRSHGIADPISRLQVDTLDANCDRLRHHPVQDERPAPGHRARDRAGAGRDAAGHDGRLRRLAHLHARRVRRAGARHRHQRSRARAGDADAARARRRRTCWSRSTAQLPRGCTAKDIVLAIIGKIGTAGGTGYAIEFAGSTIRALSAWKAA